MFGRRGNEGFGKSGGPAGHPPQAAPAPAPVERAAPAAAEPVRETAVAVAPPPHQPSPIARKKMPRTEDYYDTKSQVFSALIDTIDLSQLAKLDTESARE